MSFMIILLIWLKHKMCGKAIGETNDQVIDTVHKWVNKRMTTSMYVVRRTETEAHGEKLLQTVLHENSYNVEIE